MFNRYHHKGLKTSRTKSKRLVILGLITLVSLLSLGMTNLLIAHAGQPGRQTVNTMGDKDDLPNAPTGSITCSRSRQGQGTIAGTITDTKTGQPVNNAYIGISPGLINSFGCYTYTDTNGKFSINHLPAGTYNLSASRWKVNGTDPLYRDSVLRQIPIGIGTTTVQLALTPLLSPGYRVIGKGDAQNLIIVDMDETYFNSWFIDKKSVADPKLTPATHGLARMGVNAYQDWTQYGYSPIDHYQLATGGFPVWRTPDGPAPYWTQPNPNLDVNLWYTGGPTTAEEFGQQSIFDVAKSYGMNTAVIGGNDYPAGHITNANIDQVSLTDPNPCSAPLSEVQSMENFINAHITNHNGFLLYAPLTQAEGYNTENTSPDAPPAILDCNSLNGWSYAKASIWDDQALAALLKYMTTKKQGKSTLLQNTTIIITADEAQNDNTSFDNFYPRRQGEPGLGSTRHLPFVMEGPDIKQGLIYKSQLRIDDTSVNAMASLGLPAPADSRGRFISDFFITPPEVPIAPAPRQIIPSQGFIPLLENNVGGYSTYIHAQNESTVPITHASIIVYDQSGNIVVNQPLHAPFAPNADWVINAQALGLPQGFLGTAILHADQPLAIISTAKPASQKASPESVEGYVAAEVGSTLYAPIVYPKGKPVKSYLAITNLAPCTPCATMVTVNIYTPQGKLTAKAGSKLAAHGQWVLDLSQLNGVGNNSNSTYSAVVTSNPPEPLAATVFTKSGNLRSFSFNALSSGDTSLTAPEVFNNVNALTTSLTLQNTATSTSNVTITYRDPSGKTVTTQKLTIPARGSATESADHSGLPKSFVGSASLKADKKIAATSLVTASSGNVSAYNLVRNVDYTLFTTVYEPHLQNAVSGVTSAVTVTNNGTLSTTAQIQYFNYDGNSVGSTPTATLAPGASYTFNQGDSSSGLPIGFVGTANVTSSEAQQHLATAVTFNGNGTAEGYGGSQAQTGQLFLTIAQLRQQYQAFAGQVVTVKSAIVTRNFNSNWFIQDNTSGIRVYIGGGVNEQIGDVEMVTGVLAEYSGELEIDPSGASSVVKLGTGTVPTPIVVTTKQIAQLKYTDLIDGELATIPVSTITAYNPPSLGLTDSSNVQCAAYFDTYAQKNIDLTKFMQGEQVVTIGVLAMYGTDLQHATGEIEPLLTSDFVKH